MELKSPMAEETDSITIQISDDKMEARISINWESFKDKGLDMQIMKEALLKSHVKYGINKGVIDKILKTINREKINVLNELIAIGKSEIIGRKDSVRLNGAFSKKMYIEKKVKLKKKNHNKDKNSHLFSKILGKIKKDSSKEKNFQENTKEDYFIKKIPARKTEILPQETLLLEIFYSVHGKSGMTVTGEEIWSKENIRISKPISILPGRNVIKKESKDSKKYFSICEGNAYLLNNQLLEVEEKIDAWYKIWVSEDKKKAGMSFFTFCGEGKKLDKSEVYYDLKNRGIVFSDHKDILDKAIDIINNKEKTEIKHLIIAKAKEPIDGKDGYIKILININSKQLNGEQKTERIDFRNIHEYKHISAGESIGKIVAPTPGENGMNVIGKPIKASIGRRYQLFASDHIEVIGNEVKAKKSGFIYVHNGKITILPVLVISKDVDYKVGNINFDGDVFIKGNVLEGFSVKATGNIEIDKIVEASIVEAGKSIKIKGGVKGKGMAIIRSGSSVSLKFCEFAEVYAGEDIHIERHSIFSNLFAKNNLRIGGQYATKGSGIIIGGNLFAWNRIEARDVGKDGTNSRSHLTLGFDYSFYKRLKRIDRKVQKLQDKILQLDSKIKKLKTGFKNADIIRINEGLRVRKLNLLNLYSSLRSKYRENLINNNCEGIFLSGKIYPKNTITILSYNHTFETLTPKMHFAIKGDEGKFLEITSSAGRKEIKQL